MVRGPGEKIPVGTVHNWLISATQEVEPALRMALRQGLYQAASDETGSPSDEEGAFRIALHAGRPR